MFRQNNPLAFTIALLLTQAASSLAADAPASSETSTNAPHTRLPQVNVNANGTPATTAPTGPAESQPVDSTGRPEWTSQRRFANTRVYLQDAPGEVSFEQWYRMQLSAGGAMENLFEEEIEIGLPYRMQLDLYENWTVDEDRHTRHNSVSFELRYALADWGKIPLNPTLYAEYKAAPHVSDSFYELKLLLGADITPRLHWGFNASREAQLGGERSVEWELTQGLSYSVLDQRLGLGVEMEWGDVTVAGERSNHLRRFLIGPSIQYRPTKNTHIDLVVEGGVTNQLYLQTFVIFGIDFGPGGREEHYVPASIRGN